MKRIIISATSDLVTDQRVHKVTQSCVFAGYDVIVICREKKDSLKIDDRNYKVKRFKLWFEKGPLFYALFNLRLFLFLLSDKADIYIANDLDTLAANFLASRIKNVPVLFDNHEYFTGVPELLERSFIRKFWKAIERYIFPKLKYIYTVNDSLKNIFEKEYNVPVEVIRNIPLCGDGKTENKNTTIDIRRDKKIVLYQGAINKDRGIEEAIQAMQYIDGVLLLIVGDGDVINEVKKLAGDLNLQDKVKFTGKIPFRELINYTQLADLGLCIEKPTNINYIYSLPNKLFDYIRSGVPVLASHLPEVEHIINQYSIGEFIESHDPQHIASRIRKCLEDESSHALWKLNLKIASNNLCWENEEKILLQMIARALDQK